MLDRWPGVKGNRWKERWKVGRRVGDTTPLGVASPSTSTLLPFPPFSFTQVLKVVVTGAACTSTANLPQNSETMLPAHFPYHCLQMSAFFPSSLI